MLEIGIRKRESSNRSQGDISAFTTGEIMYCTLTMMVGAIVHSIIVGQVIGEVTSDNTAPCLRSKFFLLERIEMSL